MAIVSINEIRITDQNGSLVIIHGKIAEKDAIKASLSDFFISCSPYFKANIAMITQASAVTPIVQAPGHLDHIAAQKKQ